VVEDEPGPDADSERNLTYSADFPVGNQITAGTWWGPDEPAALVSLDEEYARSAGIGVGDTLSFVVADRELNAKVASLRKIDWDSLRPNFFIIFTPSALRDMPSTFMTAFHLPRERKTFLVGLLSTYPTISVVEVDGLIEQVRSIVDRVTLAIELVLVLVLVAGGLVLVASVLSSIDERVREHALLRTLGAPRRLIVGALATEFAVLGALAGLLAAFGAEISLFVLQWKVFGLANTFHPWIFLAGPACGVAIIGTLGLLATRRVLTTPPVIVLRGG
jgi:putative ABC transport system permease protein